MPEGIRARGRVLVVDDEPYVRESLGELLRARRFDVDLSGAVSEAVEVLGRSPVDVVLTDLKMAGGGGLELVRRLRALYPDLPVVVLTGHGTIPSAVACVRDGASDYLLKPADPDALEVALDRALAGAALRREVDYLRRGRGGASEGDEPTGVSPAWNRVVRQARAAAVTDSTILILGESGTGKDLLARMIHQSSGRAGGPFIRVNCAAVPVDMWESEFFGHRRGAFTGAAADRDGRFKLAHRGTLLMDEVGAMPLAAQAKILRALQDGEFDRLGDERPTRVDVRVIAATNSDLAGEAAAGRFRSDLLYRLDVVRLQVPPLRDRPEDIPPLAERFVHEIATRLGRVAPPLDAATLAELQGYAWPGNVRELRNVIERALILNPGGTLAPVDLPPAAGEPAPTGGEAGAASDLNLRAALAARERELLIQALGRSGGVRKEAARLLGIDQRNLGYYLRKHGIDPDLPGV